MARAKREIIGTITIDPKQLTQNRGHDYGAGRKAQVHKRRDEKRAKEKLKKEINGW